jgi:hypothetical protein
MAKIVPYLLGGLTAFLVVDIVPIPSPSEYLRVLRGGTSEAGILLGTPASSINRPAKGDRGAAARPAETPTRIATVEVIGLRDAAIVYRDRDGRELFRTDPVNNVTIVTKGLQLPEVTVRQHNGSVVQPVPVEVLHEQAPARKPPNHRERKIPIGCEPSFSPVAAPSLAHHTGRCVARLKTPGTLALLDG